MLTTAPVLGFADYQQPFIVETDASDLGLGAVLSQVQDGRTRIIAYASRGLSKAEKKPKQLLVEEAGVAGFEVGGVRQIQGPFVGWSVHAIHR